MTSAAVDVDIDRPVARFSVIAVGSLAFVVAVLHCAAAAFSSGYWFDEVYMLAIGRYHLDWGSADQPPAAPALAALMDAVAPGSHVALALPAALASGCAVLLAGLIARELGGDRRAQFLTALAQATGLWATLAGHWLTPYSLEPAQWLLLVWLLLRWVRVRDDRLLLMLGAVLGVAAMTQLRALLLAAALVFAVATAGPRDLLRRPMLWAGAVVAAVIVSPALVWQDANGWPQLKMTHVVAGEADALYGGRPGIAVQLLLLAGALGLALGGYGLWRLLRASEARQYRFLAVAFVVLYVSFVVTEGRPYYVAGLYAPLAAAGAVGLQQRREARGGRQWPTWTAAALGTALAAGALVLSVSLTRSEVGEHIARRTTDVLRALPAQQQGRTAIVGESYIVAAYLDGYSDRYHIPEAYSLSRSYGYFAPPGPGLDTVLYVGRGPGPLRPYFAAAQPMADVGDDMHVYLLTGQRQSWTSIWARERTLTVS